MNLTLPPCSVSPSVLVVDDDPVVLNVTVRALQLHGFACERATCGSEALLLLSRDAGRFDALLVDMGLPDIAFAALRQRIAALAPGLPVVAMSGRLPDGVDGIDAFVAKPFSLAELAQTLRRAAAHAVLVADAV